MPFVVLPPLTRSFNVEAVGKLLPEISRWGPKKVDLVERSLRAGQQVRNVQETPRMPVT